MSATVYRSRMLSADISGIVLRMIPDHNNSLSLIVKELGDDVHNLLFIHGENPLQIPAEEAFSKNRRALDEWMETLVKHYYHFGEKILKPHPHKVTKRLLQYLPALDDWALTCITCYADSNDAHITFCTDNAHLNYQGCENLRQLAQAVNAFGRNGNWEIDRETKKVFLSRNMSALLGIDKKAMIINLRVFLEYIHPDDLNLFITCMEHASGDASSLTTRAQTKEGEQIYMSSYISSSYDGNSDSYRISGISKDVTPNVKSLEALEQCEARLRGLREYSWEPPHLTMDKGGRHVYAPANTSEFPGIRHADIGLYGTGGFLADLSRDKDELTRFYNRQSFWRMLEQCYKQESSRFSLVVMDVDGLRLVNDVLGFQQGDETLREAAEILREAFGADCVIGRIGEDEFAVLKKDSGLADVEACCAAVGRLCEKTKRRILPLNISWGFADCREAPDARGLLSLAQARMHGHKRFERRSHHNQTLASLKEVLRARNLETADHTQRIEDMASRIGKRIGLDSGELDRLRLLAAMHDIGKLVVPDTILNKPGRLNDREWEIMKTHSEAGYKIALSSQELSDVAMEIYCHHEHWDGNGYPLGKARMEIPYLSHIIGVADAYDAMTSRRVYKEPSTHDEAVKELVRCAGTQFDPQIVASFQEIFGNADMNDIRKTV